MVQDRIGAADAKAATCLTVQLGILTALAALASGHAGRINPGALLLLLTGAGLLAASVLTAITVVTPRTHSRQTGQDPAGDLLYFGHLRTLSPTQLAEQLTSMDLLAELASQTVHTSAIAWTKHQRLHLSIRLATIGLALIALGGAAAAA